MKNKDFIHHRAMWTLNRQDIFDEKSRFYTKGSDDRLANFKRSGKKLDQPPQKVLGTFLQKHLDGVFYWIASGKESKEGLRQNVYDAQNYLDLLLAIYEEALS